MQGKDCNDCPWFPSWVREEPGQRSRNRRSGCWRDRLLVDEISEIHGRSSIALEQMTAKPKTFKESGM